MNSTQETGASIALAQDGGARRDCVGARVPTHHTPVRRVHAQHHGRCSHRRGLPLSEHYCPRRSRREPW